MNLQTKIPLVKQFENLIDYHSNVLLLGSCFSEHIGDKFAYYKFQTQQNPFGIIFQPQALEKLIIRALQHRQFCETDVFCRNEHWHCFEAHSQLSAASKDMLLEDLNASLSVLDKTLKESSHIVLTLGTAWVYRFLETNQSVANCHKVPQNQFKKELLSIAEIEQALEAIVSSIKSVNPKAVILFTISPVRHVKDGFVENTLSKSHLITAVHAVLKHNAHNDLCYFPSYEIMMDELRDYRFYAADMLHPNQVAIDYIWERFVTTQMHADTLDIMNEIASIQKGLQHRPFNPESAAHQDFLQNLELKKEKLQQEFPAIIF